MRRTTPAILGIALAFVCPEAAFAADLPQLKWDKPIRCINGPAGVVRVQCEGTAEARRCLVAPNQTREGGELHRTQPCEKVEEAPAYEKLVGEGAEMVPAIAETPPGFARSEKGRAYQVKFDLLDRFYVGASWVPTYQRLNVQNPATPPGFPFGRGQAELGFEVSVLSPHGRSRHDIRVLEGTAAFKDLEINGQVFSYDYQHLHRRPAFWITSFFGPPRLHEVALPLGWGFRVLRIEDRPPAFRNTLDMEFAEAHMAWNPWQSNDMYSHLRVEAGADFGRYWADRMAISTAGRWYAGFTGAVRSRVSLGEGGLHNLFVDLTYLRPTLVEGDLAGRPSNRLKASVAYEGILVALNDQPLSFRLAAIGAARDDPATEARSVELGVNAGLRFSFWAPPRIFEPMPELEDP